MKVPELMATAVRAATSARLLLDIGDPSGGCNRADYAMFDAAPAALLASGAPVDREIAKSHNRLIAAFGGMHLVKTGRVLVQHGKALNKVDDLRLVADYMDEPIDRDHAISAVARGRDLVASMHAGDVHGEGVGSQQRRQWEAVPAHAGPPEPAFGRQGSEEKLWLGHFRICLHARGRRTFPLAVRSTAHYLTGC